MLGVKVMSITGSSWHRARAAAHFAAEAVLIHVSVGIGVFCCFAVQVLVHVATHRMEYLQRV